jgi:outer membrane autotransporter protein
MTHAISAATMWLMSMLPVQAAQAASDTAQTFAERLFAPDTIFNLNGVRVWQTVYAGRSSLAGDAGQGTENVTASILGTTFGADRQIDALTLIGASLGLSHQTFSSDSGNGRSDDVAATLYGRRTIFDQAYISLALGYGWHDVSTHRPVPLLNFLSFDANYHAHDFGGRLEGGYTFTVDTTSSIVPFIAVVGDAYHQPGYSESAPSLLSDFAASYLPSTIGVTHAELGSRYFHAFTAGDMDISLDTNIAWERELDDNPLVLASFQTAPGSYYVLHGTRPAPDTALLGLGFRMVDGGFTFGIRSDGRLGNGTTILSGTADITYQW